MNKTKKLTTGAMMLAIIGALILIDRQFSYFLKEIIVLLTPVVIILYATMYELKDGAIFSISLLILGFLLGSDIYYYCYLPISIVVALAYSFGIKKECSKVKLLLISMGFFIIGEALVTFILYPLLGLDLANQLAELKTMYEGVLTQAGTGTQIFTTLGIDFGSLILVCFVISTVLMGVMEGLIIHILAIFLLNRLKIKSIAKGDILNVNLDPTWSYILIVGASLIYLIGRVENQDIKLAFVTISIICSFVLCFYGYIFLTMYMRLRTGRTRTSFLLIIAIILLMPFSIIVLIIIGFLYGAGPLKKTLNKLTTPQQ